MEGEGAYKVPSFTVREFSGQRLSVMERRCSSLGASSPSGKYIYQNFCANSCMFLSPEYLIFHLPFVYSVRIGGSNS